MVQQVCCAHCSAPIEFSVVGAHQHQVWCINLEYTMFDNQCPECGNIEDTSKRVSFCNKNCLTKWLQTYADGFPCPDCRETGYKFGFQQNGTCTTCKGSKYVKA